jgi:hypothetical protein
MSDYFDRVEQGMREAVRRGAHEPWYLRLRPRLSRPVVVAIACLVATGSALAASGVFRTGAPVGAEVAPTPGANEGAVITSTVRLLPLRVSDPRGGPPWGLQVLKTTRGLMCVQPGRIVNGRLGALGEDGAFGNDGAFHPLSIDFLSGGGCGTQDAHGNAFLNEELYGLPANALPSGQHHSSGGCYANPAGPKTCPDSDRRDLYFGLLGPDATSITYATPARQLTTVPTAGQDGAYLIVLPHSRERCAPPEISCVRSESGDMVVGPELEPSPAIRTVTYTNAPPCRLPSPAQAAELRALQESKMRALVRIRLPDVYRTRYYHERYMRGSIHKLTPAQQRAFEALRAPILRAEERGPRCPAVGYSPLSGEHAITPAEIASPVSAHIEVARHYCERLESTVPCDRSIPKGYTRISMRGGPPETLLVIQFTARAAVTNFDRHYEINVSDAHDRSNPKCPGPGGGSFGPTQTNLRVGQHVRFTTFVNTECPGRSHITVGLVTVNGPSGSMPVPGLPGQSAEIPVGATDVFVP